MGARMFWSFDIRILKLSRISTCPPPVWLCPAIATASQWPVQYPLQALNSSGQAGGYLNFGFESRYWQSKSPNLTKLESTVMLP